MTDTIKEITDFSPHHHFHPFDPEDPEAFSTCIEEKKYLLKSYQQRRYFGRHIPFCWRNNEPFLTLGPQWPLFLVTWCGLLGIGVFVIIHIPGNRSPFLRVSAVIVTIWQSMIYLLTALKNPGIVTAKDANDLTLLKSNCQANCCKICKVCKVVTTKDMRHCSNCKVCIKGFDHHCPWTGKCIGAGNACQFYTFLFSTAFYITFCMVVAGLYLK